MSPIRGLYPQVQGGNIWELAPEVRPPNRCFKKTLMFREWLGLWEYPGDQIKRMHEDHLCFLLEDIRLKHLAKFIAWALESGMSRCLSIQYMRGEGLIMGRERTQQEKN